MNNFFSIVSSLSTLVLAGFTFWLAKKTSEMAASSERSLSLLVSQSELLAQSSAAEVKQADFAAKLYNLGREPFVTASSDEGSVYYEGESLVAEVTLLNSGQGVAFFPRDEMLPDFMYFDGPHRHTALAKPFLSVLPPGASVKLRFELLAPHSPSAVPTGSWDGRSPIAALNLTYSDHGRNFRFSDRLIFASGTRGTTGNLVTTLVLIDQETSEPAPRGATAGGDPFTFTN
jgi:hypothetical protein